MNIYLTHRAAARAVYNAVQTGRIAATDRVTIRRHRKIAKGGWQIDLGYVVFATIDNLRIAL